jgi:hypothetical protein
VKSLPKSSHLLIRTLAVFLFMTCLATRLFVLSNSMKDLDFHTRRASNSNLLGMSPSAALLSLRKLQKVSCNPDRKKGRQGGVFLPPPSLGICGCCQCAEHYPNVRLKSHLSHLLSETISLRSLPKKLLASRGLSNLHLTDLCCVAEISPTDNRSACLEKLKAVTAVDGIHNQ